MAERKGKAPVKAAPKSNAKPETPTKSGGHLKLIIIIIFVVLIAATAAGAGVYFYLSKTVAEPDNTPKPLIYYPMEPLTSNFAAVRPVRFLRLGITVVTRDANVVAAIGQHLPKIRNDILTLLAEQAYAQLNQPAGKETLRTQIQEVIAAGLVHAGQPAPIEHILFTELVMQ
ncbi:flagellar basal body-associated FliL family protein [Thiospirillum jenense]|uniref:Flagellar protein FliL n=1 Tax=Thiospirillum jenense TaxID=1653858 RepID=A0A839HEU3_9GAMM|nr:flagellar basal body-associated FliL family protein [Thiospirillum jenense]MBB1125768.1 flagellar basal body-associated FliL family protein [Thiospirillum jenense]